MKISFSMKETWICIFLVKVQRSFWYPLKISPCNIYHETINIVIQNWLKAKYNFNDKPLERCWEGWQIFAYDFCAVSSRLTSEVLIRIQSTKNDPLRSFCMKVVCRLSQKLKMIVYLFKFPLRSATRIFQSIDIHFLSLNWFLKSTMYCHISRTLPDMQISFFKKQHLCRTSGFLLALFNTPAGYQNWFEMVSRVFTSC